jgi:hypothetical protein
MANWGDCYDTIRQMEVSECRAMRDVILKYVSLRFHVNETKTGNKYSYTENLILTANCKWHLGSSWYTPDLNIVTINIQTFVPPCHQGLHPGLEDMGVKCLQPRDDDSWHHEASDANRLPACT